MKRTLLPILFLFVLITPPAQAGWKIDRAKAIAAKVWHDPCNGDVTISWGYTYDAVAYAGNCAIVLDEDTTTDFVSLCSTIIHEYGHLAGFTDPTNTEDPYHSSNPNSIMHQDTFSIIDRSGGYPTYYNMDRRCRGRGRPYLGLGPSRLHEVFATTHEG
jgi:hypothetical protein